ncbi:hypothetical protein MnTg02_01189 [bacterium MnTg02]|nr:hypothetical protein MnTg02_01189 [bacterium MnTg02]
MQCYAIQSRRKHPVAKLLGKGFYHPFTERSRERDIGNPLIAGRARNHGLFGPFRKSGHLGDGLLDIRLRLLHIGIGIELQADDACTLARN